MLVTEDNQGATNAGAGVYEGEKGVVESLGMRCLVTGLATDGRQLNKRGS